MTAEGGDGGEDGEGREGGDHLAGPGEGLDCTAAYCIVPELSAGTWTSGVQGVRAEVILLGTYGESPD